ncbi:hypothetical protein L1049_008280 [Liquidambar formosana]|uniref:Uncharacterized protein n=1 Tax=Liquidambar formosana TaxID=63359 RepID=A0AAP0S9K3_LIQFO
MHCLDTQPNKEKLIFPLERGLRSSSSLGHLSSNESGLPNPTLAVLFMIIDLWRMKPWMFD